MKLFDKVLCKFDKEYLIKKMRQGGAKIGNNFYCQGSVIDPGFLFLIEIGDNVTLTHATILAHDAGPYHDLKKSRVGKVKIGNNVFIGYQSIILPNVKIGDNVVIGAGSIVTKDIPSNSVAAGNPCRVMGTYENYLVKHKEAMKSHPIYTTYHRNKSKKEIELMQKELESTWGYDI